MTTAIENIKEALEKGAELHEMANDCLKSHAEQIKILVGRLAALEWVHNKHIEHSTSVLKDFESRLQELERSA